MKGKRLSEEQIIRILKANESEANVSDLIREHGIAEQSFHRWKAKYDGMEVSEAKRLRELEAENAKLTTEKNMPITFKSKHSPDVVMLRSSA